jgi:ferritin-like metal-binding protein YciE
MPKKTGGLQQLLLEELQDLLDAEKQLVKALPNIAKSVSDSELQQLFRNHLETTKLQVQRLEEVFESMDTPARGKPCKAMKGMVEESRDIIQEHEKQLLNSALAGSARKVEHYEIAAYESAQSLAQELGLTEAVQRLQATLKEEVETERRFSEISKRLLKESSSMAEEGEMEESVESEGRQPRRRGDGAQASSRASSGASNRRSSSRASKARPSAKTSQTTASGRSPAKSASSGRSSSGRSASSGRAKSSAGGRSAASAHPLTDHEEIREWAEQRKAQPACVRGTGGSEDIGMIRLDFPGYSGQESLEPISWDDWFEKFDERGLALIVQDKTSGGQKSNFNKLVSREGLERPKTRSAH